MSDGNRESSILNDGQVHELKNRLTVIKGMTQLLARQVQRDDWERERIIERVDSLQTEVTRLETMIERLRMQGQSIEQEERIESPRLSDR